MPTPPHPPPLHPLEREVMEQLWAQQPATGREVYAAINAAATRDRAYTTVMTVLGRLVDKGFVERERVGRTDVYRPAVLRDTWVRARAEAEVAGLLQAYGDVALAQFARQVEGLDDERRAQLRRIVDGE
jgi:predicted transcriptional regulator